jgi:hypothetical protein
MAKEKERAVGTRECGFEGLWAPRALCFHPSQALCTAKEKETEEVKTGIVVALSLVAEWVTIEHKPRVSGRFEGKATH